MLFKLLDRLPGPIRTIAYRHVQAGPFYSWKLLIFAVFMMVFFWFAVHGVWNEPGTWHEPITYMFIIMPIFGFPSFALLIYGKYYADKLDLPPLEEKYIPLPNLGYIIMAGIGGFGLIKWLLGW